MKKQYKKPQLLSIGLGGGIMLSNGSPADPCVVDSPYFDEGAEFKGNLPPGWELD